VQLSRRAAIALATCGLTYWLTFGGTFGGALSPVHQIIGHVLVFLMMAGASWQLLRPDSPKEYRSLPLDLSVLVGLILLETTARALLQRSWNSAEYFALSISGFVVFMLLLNWFWAEGDLVIVCVSAAVICTLLGIVVAHWRGEGTLALPLGNRVLMAGLLTLTTPLAIGGFRTHQGGSAGKLLWLSGALILAVGVIETRSAIAIMLLPFGVVLVLVAGEKRRLRVAATLGLAILILCGALYVGRFGPLTRVTSIVRSGADSTQSLENRLRYWSGALAAIGEKPLAGWGAGQVGITYPPFRIQRPGYAPSGEVVADLHSVPMQWAYEFGLIGLVLRLSAFGVLLSSGYSRKTPTQRSAVISLGVFGVFCLLHYNLSNPATSALAVVIAVMAVDGGTQFKLANLASKRLGLVLICCALALLSFQARLDYANYLLALSASQPAKEAIEATLRAGIVDSRGGFYDAVAAIRIEQLGEDSKDRPFLLHAADSHYRRALDLSPWSSHLTAAYADFLIRAGRQCEAVEMLQRAVSLDFYFSLSHFNLANAYSSCRASDAAVTEAGIAILTAPTLAYSAQWRKNPEFLSRALDESLEWISGWKTTSSQLAEDGQLRRLEAFIKVVRSAPSAGAARVKIILSERVGAQLISDPFAYIFHRRSPLFEPTRIEIDGVDTGSWTPEGIGEIKSLRSLRYAELSRAYQQQAVHVLMRSLSQSAER